MTSMEGEVAGDDGRVTSGYSGLCGWNNYDKSKIQIPNQKNVEITKKKKKKKKKKLKGGCKEGGWWKKKKKEARLLERVDNVVRRRERTESFFFPVFFSSTLRSLWNVSLIVAGITWRKLLVMIWFNHTKLPMLNGWKLRYFTLSMLVAFSSFLWHFHLLIMQVPVGTPINDILIFFFNFFFRKWYIVYWMTFLTYALLAVKCPIGLTAE
jgi:hypothetical protein